MHDGKRLLRMRRMQQHALSASEDCIRHRNSHQHVAQTSDCLLYSCVHTKPATPVCTVVPLRQFWQANCRLQPLPCGSTHEVICPLSLKMPIRRKL